MGDFSSKVYREPGGDRLVVDAGGAIQIMEGGQILPDGGTQAAHIADLAAISGGESPTEAEHNAVRTAVNAILAALRGAGIIAQPPG